MGSTVIHIMEFLVNVIIFKILNIYLNFEFIIFINKIYNKLSFYKFY